MLKKPRSPLPEPGRHGGISCWAAPHIPSSSTYFLEFGFLPGNAKVTECRGNIFSSLGGRKALMDHEMHKDRKHTAYGYSLKKMSYFVALWALRLNFSSFLIAEILRCA